MNWLWNTADGLLIPLGALLLCLLLGLLVHRLRRTDSDRLAVNVAVLIASVFSAEGMFEVATEKLKLPWLLAVALFAVAEAAMLAEAVRAKRQHAQGKGLGRHGRAVWAIAVAAGVIVALNSKSLVEFPVRLGMPILVAALWWLGYQDDAAPAQRSADAITWRISPRRVLVWLRLAEPGERDVIEVDRDRRITALTTIAHRLHHGRWFKGLRTAKLRRLALAADDAMLAEVQVRIARVARVSELTAPATAEVPAAMPALPPTPDPEPAPEPVEDAADTQPEPAPKPRKTPARPPVDATPREYRTDQALKEFAADAAVPAQLVDVITRRIAHSYNGRWTPKDWDTAVALALNARVPLGGALRLDDVQTGCGIGRNRAVELRREVLEVLDPQHFSPLPTTNAA